MDAPSAQLTINFGVPIEKIPRKRIRRPKRKPRLGEAFWERCCKWTFWSEIDPAALLTDKQLFQLEVTDGGETEGATV